MKINNTLISENNRPYIIAEFSGNHDGDINNFFKLIKVAKNAGANAIKLQTFQPHELTINSKKKHFIVNHKFKKWNNKTLYQLYTEAYTPWEWHHKIKQVAKKNKLDFICTAFHESSVDFLKKINVDCIKISSFEFNDINLIKYASNTKIPMILSTGMASLKEIKTNYTILKKKLKKNFAFLKCTSSYPASLENLNLNTIQFLKNKFSCEFGFSDHSIDDVGSISAVIKGATIIEKHICLGRNKGIDSNFSNTPKQFYEFVKNCNKAWKTLGEIKFGPTPQEKNSYKNRKSLFAIQNINKGDKFTKKNIGSIRPGLGLEPNKFVYLKGKISKKNFEKGDPIKLG
jgi:pseudaminic acid synthase